MSGYQHRDYAHSFSEFGRPYSLARCGGWILARSIPGTSYSDAMGCYPLFDCRDWSQLADDLADISSHFVSLTVLPVPFGGHDIPFLERTFDRVTHFKDHFVADLRRPLEDVVKRSHRATARRALNKVEVSICPRPIDYLDRWMDLYGELINRHNIKSLNMFSRTVFAKQLVVPGTYMFEARYREETVGLDWWYIQGGVAYGHLAAFSKLGYQLRASYATKWKLLEYFSDKACWADFGGAAGLHNTKDGLTDYKQGWASGVKPVYLCGKIFKPDIYRELGKKVVPNDYFPIYRSGEFV